VAFSTPIWAVLVFLVAFSPVFGELLAFYRLFGISVIPHALFLTAP